MKKCYILDCKNPIHFNQNIDIKLFNELLTGYVYNAMEFDLLNDLQSLEIYCGDYEKHPLGENEYVVNITDNGLYICGSTYDNLVKGFFTLLENLNYQEEAPILTLTCKFICGDNDIKFRSVHFCVFPETKYQFLRKCIRTSAALKYTHIILEFWGSLEFNALKELSWNDAFSKDDIRPLIKEARAFGLDVIPMLNILGHASSSRCFSGKHVVLDQNPRLSYLFTNGGWVWNYRLDEVSSIITGVIDELIELCGDGKYFHMGCDEAFIDDSNIDSAVEYINKIINMLINHNRRPIMWGDMMLYGGNLFYTAYSEFTANKFLEGIDKRVVIADWHYDYKTSDWESSHRISQAGFDVVCCPWNEIDNVKATVDNIRMQNLFGVMHTTWDTASKWFFVIGYTAKLCESNYKFSRFEVLNGEMAELVRKLMPSRGDYELSGWIEHQITN